MFGILLAMFRSNDRFAGMSELPEPLEHRGRGRPAKANPRNQMIKVAFSDEEYRWVVERAGSHDLSLSDYCRRKVLGRTVPFSDGGAAVASADFTEALSRLEPREPDQGAPGSERFTKPS